jgi:hypothetical protein
MNILDDVITYIRRIIKSPSNAEISDNLIIDYINRFWINDVAARVQLFDMKTKYQFQTVPGVDQYNMPLYQVQTEGANPSSNISFYPVYQGFLPPVYCNGIEVTFYTQRATFFAGFPNVVQNLSVVGTGNGSSGPYTLNIPFLSNPGSPINPPVNAVLRGHVDISGIIATGTDTDPPVVSTLNTNIPVTSTFPAVYFTSTAADGSNIIVADSGQFLLGNQNYGLLMEPGQAPTGNIALSGGYSTSLNTINYLTGQAIVNFPTSVPAGAQINGQCFFFQTGLPRAVLYYNNILTIRPPPDRQYLIELDAYLSPAAFLVNANPVQFGYMSEYLARGAARKILSDTGDIEQLQFYEPLFREQEQLVWKRSQRQFTSTRTQTLYSYGPYQGQISPNGLGSTSL